MQLLYMIRLCLIYQSVCQYDFFHDNVVSITITKIRVIEA